MKKSIEAAALLGVMSLALVPIAPAFAANWVYVDKNVDGAVHYYDADTLQRSGDEVTIWDKVDHSRDATTKLRSTTALIRYFCSRRTYTLISYTVYYANGKIESASWSPNQQTETYIAPDTIAESKLKAVCNED